MTEGTKPKIMLNLNRRGPEFWPVTMAHILDRRGRLLAEDEFKRIPFFLQPANVCTVMHPNRNKGEAFEWGGTMPDFVGAVVTMVNGLTFFVVETPDQLLNPPPEPVQ